MHASCKLLEGQKHPCLPDEIVTVLQAISKDPMIRRPQHRCLSHNEQRDQGWLYMLTRKFHVLR